MEYLVDAKKMKQCDQAAIEGLGIPSMVLMERAALAVTEEILKARPQPAPVLVVCGSGNNGGDGFAIARLLAEQKIAVEVLFAGKDASMTEECRRQKTICENCNIKIVRNFPEREYTTIVDALFGIGLSRDVKGVYAELIENSSRYSVRHPLRYRQCFFCGGACRSDGDICCTEAWPGAVSGGGFLRKSRLPLSRDTGSEGRCSCVSSGSGGFMPTSWTAAMVE